MTREDSTNIDVIDAAAIKTRRVERDKIRIPQVGDYIRYPDGQLRRLTYRFKDHVQATWPVIGEGSFYMGTDGVADYSGPLDSPIPRAALHGTDETRDAPFWMFIHEQAKAHNGLRFELEVRVWEYRPD